MELKYVIVNVAFADLAPIVFREDLGHDIPVLGLRREAVDSAGFVSVKADPDRPGRIKATAYGRSTGLNLAANVDRDSQILTRFFNPDADVVWPSIDLEPLGYLVVWDRRAKGPSDRKFKYTKREALALKQELDENGWLNVEIHAVYPSRII